MEYFDFGSFLLGILLSTIVFMLLACFYLEDRTRKHKRWNEAFSDLQARYRKLTEEYNAHLWAMGANKCDGLSHEKGSIE